MSKYGGTFKKGTELRHLKIAKSRRAKIRAEFYPSLLGDVEALCGRLNNLVAPWNNPTVTLAVELITSALRSHHVSGNNYMLIIS